MQKYCSKEILSIYFANNCIYIYIDLINKSLPYFKKLLTARKKERKKERKRNEEKKMNFHRDYVH